jgi:hypothetical protein
MAQPPTWTPTLVLRAGLTEVFVTGMLIRWCQTQTDGDRCEACRRARISLGGDVALDRFEGVLSARSPAFLLKGSFP